MEARTLSSAQTVLMKLVFPPLWIGGFAIATTTLFLAPTALVDSSGAPADPGMKWTFLLLTVFGTAFIWWSCIRLKRVRLDDRMLYVSNYSREIAVPLVSVAEVKENRWLNIHPVTIELPRDRVWVAYCFHAEGSVVWSLVVSSGRRRDSHCSIAGHRACSRRCGL